MNDEYDEELTEEELEELASAFPDTMLQHDSKYLPTALMVDSVLRAETRQAAALALVDLISHLTERRSKSEQAFVIATATLQAYGYTPLIFQVFAQTTKDLVNELQRRQARKGRKK
jgi:hypothetical protein